MLYPALRTVAATALRWFYSRIDAEGLERIPAGAPALLAVNHPNALVDAMVVACVVPRRVLFTGRATLFTNPLLAAFLRAAGVVPLIRAKDVAAVQSASDARRNEDAFARLRHALSAGGAVLIFPEGITGDHPSLAPLRTGVARLALQARDAGVGGLMVVPIGLTFERKDTPRSRVYVQVGEPIDVSTWPRSSDDDARRLTDELERRLRAVTLNFETADAAANSRALASSFARLFRGADVTPEVWQPHAPLTEQVAITKRIEAARSRLASAPAPMRARADALLVRLTRFREELATRRLAIEDVEIDLDVPAGTVFVLREAAAVLVAGPIAVWGWLNHLLPFTLAGAIAVRRIESAADPAMRTIVGGIVLVLAFYAAQGAAVLAWLGPAVAAAYVISLPIAAELNFYMRARLTRVVRRARAYLRLRSEPALRARLSSELRALRIEALEMEAALSKPRAQSPQPKS